MTNGNIIFTINITIRINFEDPWKIVAFCSHKIGRHYKKKGVGNRVRAKYIRELLFADDNSYTHKLIFERTNEWAEKNVLCHCDSKTRVLNYAKTSGMGTNSMQNCAEHAHALSFSDTCVCVRGVCTLYNLFIYLTILLSTVDLMCNHPKT